MNVGLCRLALFLDPRYKDLASSRGQLQGIVNQAATLHQKRKHTLEQCEILISQIMAYSAGLPPYNMPFGDLKTFNPKLWWLSLGVAADQLSSLAVFLFEICPHAATPERIFSYMGMYQSDVRNRLLVPSLAMMTTVKMHYQSQMPRVKKEASKLQEHLAEAATSALQESTQGPSGSNLGSSAEVQLGDEEEVAATPEAVRTMLTSFYEADKAEIPQNLSFTELLLGSWDGFDMQHAMLADGFVPVQAAARIVGGLGTDSSGESFDAIDLVSRAWAAHLGARHA
eukprot:jgi/Chrzof1/4974/Cz15g07030.t1